MSVLLRRVSLTALVLAVVLAGTVAGFASGSSSSVQIVHVMSSKPDITTIDLGPRGKSPGDFYAVSASILIRNGRRVIGHLRGTQTAIKRERGAETVQGMLTFEFGTANQIVVGGLSQFPLTGTGLITGKPYVRAVLGGTGKYAGAKGTLTSTLRSSGRYDQVFRLTY
ncbi:MAG TPA: hypothetical protein VGH56_02045 [Solirubrobacteraceae bacterium]